MNDLEAAPALRTDLFDYDLPAELIAQQPAEPRDASRLLVLDRATGSIEHARFYEIGRWLRPGDLLVLNRSRVVPVRRREPGLWEALVRPGRRLPPGATVDLDGDVLGEILERTPAGGRLIRFAGSGDVDDAILAAGSLPLPPYIHGYTGDPERYQTVYGDRPGSAAAPTAGLHFTDGLLRQLGKQGIEIATVTLHVGLDTFRPVATDDLTKHAIHTEVCEVPPETVAAVERTRARGGRVVAVGTTTVRSLETAARAASVGASIVPWLGDTSLFIVPGYRYRVVDALVTNFHLPRSTLLALVSAFAGRDTILRAYRAAIEEGYRFFSFGDAMLIE